MGERAKSIGVSFKIKKIALLVFTQHLRELLLLCACQFSEKSANSVFTRMAEWRVSNIMRQATGGNYRRQFVFIEFPEIVILIRIFLSNGVAYNFTQGTAYGSHF